MELVGACRLSARTIMYVVFNVLCVSLKIMNKVGTLDKFKVMTKSPDQRFGDPLAT